MPRDRVRRYINKGIDEGAKLLTGGPTAPEGLDQGYYVRPTVFSEVRTDMTIAQEEIFGPCSVDPAVRHRRGGRRDRQRHGLWASGGVCPGGTRPEPARRPPIPAGRVEINGVTWPAPHRRRLQAIGFRSRTRSPRPRRSSLESRRYQWCAIGISNHQNCARQSGSPHRHPEDLQMTIRLSSPASACSARHVRPSSLS